jgi:CheY-like chemotaxis protein
MADEDDFFLDDDEFPDDAPAAVQTAAETAAWPLLIVDDEPDIHDVTRLALADFSYQGRGLEMLNAYSAAEAEEIVRARDDIAVILLDVVMEDDHAGLDFARKLRDEMEREAVRIILRTGQPGQAPERQVIVGFDINDYKAKSELTAERLFTSVIAALRNYADIVALNRYREDAYNVLGEQAAREQQILDMLPFPVATWDSAGVITAANPAFAAAFGSDAAQLIGADSGSVLSEQVLQAARNGSSRIEIDTGTGKSTFLILSRKLERQDGAESGHALALVPDTGRS